MEEEDMDIDDFLEFPTEIGSQGKSEVWEVENMGGQSMMKWYFVS